MYKKKYYKYKSKCSKLTKESGMASNDPDKGDGQNEDVLDPIPDEELDFDRISEDEINNNIEKIFLNRQKIDTNTEDNIMYKDIDQKVFDVGLFGKARGKSFDISDFDKSDFVKLNKSNKNNRGNKNEKNNNKIQKILKISDKNSFDDFTEKYGFINEKDQKLYIDWSLVYKHYKGILIESSSLGDRDDFVPFKNKTATNWVDYDFDHLDEVVIFKRFRNLMKSQKIIKPFKGHAVDEYAIDKADFVRITDTNVNTHDKILLIDDVKSFDKFTVKYGSIKMMKDKSNKNITHFIDIDWNKIRTEYDGFYIDKDNDFQNNRYKYAFFKDEICYSWWAKNEIQAGIVYLFK